MAASIVRTRFAGGFPRQPQTAWGVMFKSAASAAALPACSMALSSPVLSSISGVKHFRMCVSRISLLAPHPELSTIKASFMSLPDRMRLALQQAGLSNAEIARRLGVTPQAVNGWFATGTIQKRNLVKFARETGADLEELMGGQDEAGMRRTGEFRDIPIIGFAIANPEEDGFFDDMGYPPGAGDGYIPWPTHDSHAYALRVKGDSMQPRIRPGELIIVQPGSPVLPGHDVVVKTRDGRKMVKQLLYQRAGEVTLGSINQAHKQLTLSLEQIESMHYVAAIAPATAAKEKV